MANEQFQQTTVPGPPETSEQTTEYGFMSPNGAYIPATSPRAFEHFRQETMMLNEGIRSAITDYLDAAGEYPNNPYINKSAQMMVQSVSSMVNNVARSTQAAKAMQDAQISAYRGQHDIEMDKAESEDTRTKRQAMIDYAEAKGLAKGGTDEDKIAAVKKEQIELGVRQKEASIGAENRANRGEGHVSEGDKPIIPPDLRAEEIPGYLMTRKNNPALKDAIKEEEQNVVSLKAQQLREARGDDAWFKMSQAQRDQLVSEEAFTPENNEKIYLNAVRKLTLNIVNSTPKLRTEFSKYSNEEDFFASIDSRLTRDYLRARQAGSEAPKSAHIPEELKYLGPKGPTATEGKEAAAPPSRYLRLSPKETGNKKEESRRSRER